MIEKEYPLKFEACPNCGSKSRVAEEVAADEVGNGRLKVGTRIAVLISKTLVFNPADTTIMAKREAPMLIGFYDVCVQCGTLYCVEMQKGSAAIEPQVKRPGGDGHMQFLGQG